MSKPTHVSLPQPVTPALQPEDPDGLSAAELKSRLDARQREIRFRLQAIGHETGLIADDVNVGERPFIDRVRERPLAALGLALASGAMVGLLWGLRQRSKRRPDPDDRDDVIRYHVATLIDAAAMRVA
jgi:hypothetical protein